MQHDHSLDMTLVATDKLELERCRLTERHLREIIAADETLLRQKDKAIHDQALLRREAEHRLLNDLQMIGSILSLQSRATANSEVASQLAAAADRTAAIGRIHRRLRSLDGATMVAFKKFIEDLCGDFTFLVSAGTPGEREIVVEGAEIDLPTVTCQSLGCIAIELITNAAKYGKGQITVCLAQDAGKRYSLSVSNDGPPLPERYNPVAYKGLGMKIIRSLVERIGGELRFGRGDRNQGARFTVMFSV